MIRIQRILVPLDLSDCARHALLYASKLGSSYDAALHLLHVVDSQWIATTGGVAFPGYGSNLFERFEKKGEKGLAALAASIQAGQVVTAVRIGAPHVQIVQYSGDAGIDLIVLATHGRSGLTHALIGSVAEKVVQMASCPVLTVKHSEHEFVMP